MLFILICFCIYLFLKYRDLTKDMNDYFTRLQTLEDICVASKDSDVSND